MSQQTNELVTCRKCGAWIQLAYGKDSPAEHTDTAGTKSDPHAPGDWNDICAPCNYGNLTGGRTQ